MTRYSRQSNIIHPQIQIKDTKPWNSVRMYQIQTYYKNTTSRSGIFSLSHLACHEQFSNKKKQSQRKTEIRFKQKTLSEQKLFRKRKSKQQSSLNDIMLNQDLSGSIEQNYTDYANTHIPSNFRTSVQQYNQLKFLKPQMKLLLSQHQSKTKHSNKTQELSRLKTQIYKSLNQNKTIDELNIKIDRGFEVDKSPEDRNYRRQKQRNNSFVQYMTQYQGQSKSPKNETESQRSYKIKHQPISILRNKLKNRYKQSLYMQKIDQIKYDARQRVIIIQ